MASLRAMVVFTMLTGVMYPLLTTLFGQVVFPEEAGGSLLRRENRIVGSRLLAQGFSRPEYFWPRPSAVKYDGGASGASNLGPTSADLAAQVAERTARGLTAEMRFASGSGLDPHVSPMAATAQIERVAAARNLTREERADLAALVAQETKPRALGFLGQPTVNILELNLILDERFR